MGVNPRLVLFPIFAQVLLTIVVGVSMMFARRAALIRNRVGMQAVADGDGFETIFKSSENFGDNFTILFEMPVIFYVLMILVYITGMVDHVYIWGGWIYVTARVAHSAIHCTYNRVAHRFAAFFLSNLVLWAMWGRLGYQLLAGTYPQ